MRLAQAFRAVPLGLVLLAGCHGGGDLMRVDDAWVRLSPVPGRPAAAYFTLHGGPEPTRLIAVDTPAAGSSELHSSMKGAGGMMTMQRLDGVDVPAKGIVSFSPVGNHVMLFGMSAQVKPGDKITMAVRFAKGEPLQVQAKVVGAGDAAPY